MGLGSSRSAGWSIAARGRAARDERALSQVEDKREGIVDGPLLMAGEPAGELVEPFEVDGA
jgi:hypothetical protein